MQDNITEKWQTAIVNAVENNNLYALIDGLELSNLVGYAIDRYPQQDTGLYTGQLAVDYELHMPRLLQVDEELLEWLTPIIQGDIRWGFFVTLHEGMSQFDESLRYRVLLEHFQSWVHVTTPYREPWLFRFYDAAVARAMFEYGTTPELASFLGPCANILLVDTDLSVETLTMDPLPDELISRPHPIAPLHMELMQGLHTVTHQRLFGRFKSHLREHHSTVNEWPEDELDSFVKIGVQHAWAADFKSEQDMVRFLSLQVILGADFVENGDYPWVKPILNNTVSQGTQTRMDQLFDRAIAHLKQT